GDLVEQARWVRTLLDDLGNENTRIMVTSDLDEYAIASLQSAPVDSYGVGTSLVTGSGHPTASMVYKLVSRHNDAGEFVDVAKAAKNKVSVGGRKYAVRQLDERGRATEELIGIGEIPETDANDRLLLEQFVVNGEINTDFTAASGVRRAVKRHRDSIKEMPGTSRRLQRGEPVIPTRFINED
ncbi:MAG: nicotinate phosphoribosyltransferase, partial [Paeniglutamicibacter terrestris]